MSPGGFLLFALLFLGQSGFAAIFGSDTRVPFASRSTAVAVLSANFSEDGNKIKLNADLMSDLLCADERFANEPSLSFACTGFLVAPDLLVTAGHCMVNTGESRHERELHCKAFSWLFDYNSGVDVQNIPRENMYGCEEVVYAVRDEKAPFRDYAIVRLNRAVEGREPFRLARDSSLNSPLSMIGHPFGTPAKLSTSARVLLNIEVGQSFVTNLDAFDGNSGSPVLNATGEVVGILVGGTPIEAFIWDSEHSCRRYNRCADDGTGCLRPDAPDVLRSLPEFQATGSIVQRIAPVLPFLAPSFLGM